MPGGRRGQGGPQPAGLLAALQQVMGTEAALGDDTLCSKIPARHVSK